MQANYGIDRTFKAGADLALLSIVKLDTANENQVVEATAGSDPIAGIAITFGKDGKTGDTVRVQKGGFSGRVIMSAACNIGDLITATTGGKGVVTTTNHDFVVGRALQAAAANGDVIEVGLIMGFLSHA
jgi:hypothetical protein